MSQQLENGRIVHLIVVQGDTLPVSFLTIRDIKTFVRVNFVVVYAPQNTWTTNLVTLKLFYHPTTQDQGNDATNNNTGTFVASTNQTIQFTLAPTEDTPPDYFTGLSATLNQVGTGTAPSAGTINGEAWIYLQ